MRIGYTENNTYTRKNHENRTTTSFGDINRLQTTIEVSDLWHLNILGHKDDPPQRDLGNTSFPFGH